MTSTPSSQGVRHAPIHPPRCRRRRRGTRRHARIGGLGPARLGGHRRVRRPALKVQQAAGTSAAAIQSAVDAFRAELGDLNPNEPGSFGSGRREINWDGVPDALAAPNLLPADFFNVNSPRGTILSTRTGRFQVSANAGIGPIEFDNLAAGNSAQFAAFSPQRLFTQLGSTTTEVDFFVPGSTTPATAHGFGAVFTDVDRPGSTIEYYDIDGQLLGAFDIPVSPGRQTLSFLGVSFPSAVLASVRITSGKVSPQLSERAGLETVAMDDFVYGEPIA
ncbi:MAG: hypothetical protein ACR2JK_02570 [Geodermatophilaceae bacterium]